MTKVVRRLPAMAFLRDPCDQETSALVAGATGVAVMIVMTAASLLYLDNTYGPFGEDGSPGGLASLGCGVLLGGAAFLITWWAAGRSRFALIVLVTLLCTGGWVLFPRQVDVSESWRPLPSHRSSCSGWTFRHYPPETFDASSTTYCVGLEHRIADG